MKKERHTHNTSEAVESKAHEKIQSSKLKERRRIRASEEAKKTTSELLESRFWLINRL